MYISFFERSRFIFIKIFYNRLFILSFLIFIYILFNVTNLSNAASATATANSTGNGFANATANATGSESANATANATGDESVSKIANGNGTSSGTDTSGVTPEKNASKRKMSSNIGQQPKKVSATNDGSGSNSEIGKNNFYGTLNDNQGKGSSGNSSFDILALLDGILNNDVASLLNLVGAGASGANGSGVSDSKSTTPSKAKPSLRTSADRNPKSKKTSANIDDTDSDKRDEKDSQGQHTDFEKEVLKLVNEHRKSLGLSQLKLDPKLSKVAKIKSDDMYNNNYFAHNSPKHGSFANLARKNGVKNPFAENIAMGSGVVDDPRRLVDLYLNSPGHRANIEKSGARYFATSSSGDKNAMVFAR